MAPRVRAGAGERSPVPGASPPHFSSLGSGRGLPNDPSETRRPLFGINGRSAKGSHQPWLWQWRPRAPRASEWAPSPVDAETRRASRSRAPGPEPPLLRRRRQLGGRRPGGRGAVVQDPVQPPLPGFGPGAAPGQLSPRHLLTRSPRALHGRHRHSAPGAARWGRGGGQTDISVCGGDRQASYLGRQLRHGV